MSNFEYEDDDEGSNYIFLGILLISGCIVLSLIGFILWYFLGSNSNVATPATTTATSTTYAPSTVALATVAPATVAPASIAYNMISNNDTHYLAHQVII